jgi:hypothetical protein
MTLAMGAALLGKIGHGISESIAIMACAAGPSGFRALTNR